MFEKTEMAATPASRARSRPPGMLRVSRGSTAGTLVMLKQRARRAVTSNPRLDIKRFIASLQCADSQDTDLLWCQVAEGRRALETIDPVFGAVLDNPSDYAGRAELTSAERKLRLQIRRARNAGLPMLASAWLPWLYTLRATNDDDPELRTLVKRMWALIEPARIQAEEGETCLTPTGYRHDPAEVSPQYFGRHRMRRKLNVRRRRCCRTPLPRPA